MLRDFLSQIFHSVMNEPSFDKALSISGDMVAQGIEMPDILESALIDFLTDKNEASFTRLSREVLSGNFLEDYAENIKLISFLAKEGWLSLKDAAFLLSSVPHVERGKLPTSYMKAIEAADLVCEDLSDAIMEVEDDDLLINALNDI